MTGSKSLILFGVLALMGSSMAAPACDKGDPSKTRTRRLRPTKTPTSQPDEDTMTILPVSMSSAVGSVTPRPSAGVDATPDEDTPTSPNPGDSDAPAALPFSSTMLYDLDNVGIGASSISTASGVTVDAGVYIIDMAGHTDDQIAEYKAAGKTVICYFSAGTLEPGRDDARAFDPECACGPGGSYDEDNHCVGGSGDTKMEDWDEYWLDIHSENCKANVQTAQAARIAAAALKGCDGMDPDNVDSYNNGNPHGNTKEDEIDYLLWLSQTVHNAGMLIGLKNAGDLIQGEAGKTMVDAFDLSVIESCAKYEECDTYGAFLNATKPQIQIEYENSITICPDLKEGQTLAVYSGKVLNSQDITLYCPGPGA